MEECISSGLRVPAPAWVPALTAFEDELFYGTVSEINPFQAAFGHGVPPQQW